MRCAVIVSLCAITPLAAQSTRDSAGIRIVTDARPLASIQQWHVNTKAVLDIGGGDGGEHATFHDIMGAVRLADGTVAVANMATNEIRLFGPTGVFLRAASRTGSGPGEFRQLMSLALHLDTLVATDGTGGPRVFTPSGKFLRQIAPLKDAAGHELLFRGMFGDGSILYTTNGPRVAGARIYAGGLVRVAPNDPRQQSLGTVPMRENGTEESVFDARWSTAIFPDRFCHGYSTRFEITCLRPDGRPAMMIRRQVPPGPVPDSAKKIYEDVYVHPLSLEQHSGPPNAVDITRLRQAVAKFVYPKQMPAFGPFVAARTGELWVSEFQQQVDWGNGQLRPSPPKSTGWVVFAEDGRLLARIVLPARFTLTQTGTDYVLGIQRDEDDVEHVTMYRFQRS